MAQTITVQWPQNGCFYFEGQLSATFIDPTGTNSPSVRIRVPLQHEAVVGYDGIPAVSFAINGQPVGNPVSVFNASIFCDNSVTYEFFSPQLGTYNPRAANTLTIFSSGGFTNPQAAELTFSPTISIAAVAGDAQTGAVLSPLDQQIVAQVSGSAGFQVANRDVTFQVAASPSRAKGYAVGADENATSATYTVKTDPGGFARATVILGDKEGEYQITASTPVSTTPTPAMFTVLAKKPDSVVILKDTTDLADRADSYAVPSDQPTQLFAVGLDKAGQKIGPVKSVWSTAASGPGASRGNGSVNPAIATSSTMFTPSHVGQLAVTANPAISGVNTAKADLYITALYVSVDNTFSISDPVDQRDKFVPGEYLDGTDVPLSLMEQTGQFISLHVLTGPGAKGKVTFAVDPDKVSHFPGIAMNYPIQNPSTAADMAMVDSAANTPAATTVVPFAPDGDTWATLLVRDYGARGAINVTITAGKKTYTLKPVQLPTDNGQGLPAAGWHVLANHVDATNLAADSDVDNSAPSTSVGDGDGLSNFEEYRGFVAASAHVRTDPRKRDIFVVADPQLLAGIVPTSAITATLPLPVHYLDLSEVAGEDYPARGIVKGKPVINPNRAGIPGARTAGQRAVRLVMQVTYPPAVTVAIPPGVVQNYPAWQAGVFGATILDSTDPELIDQASAGGATAFSAESPDTTRWSEVYELTFTNAGIATNFNNPFYFDANGQPVPPCPNIGTINDCDEYDYAHHLVLPRIYPGGVFLLHAVPYPGDWYSKRVITCADTADILDYGFTDTEMHVARAIVGAHELGHSLHINHTLNCGNLMFQFNVPGFQPLGMIDIRPLPIFFSSDEADQIQLHP